MRALAETGSLRVHAIAGTYVVLLGFHLPEDACDGLSGFAIHKWDHTAREAHYLGGIKTFTETDPGLPPGTLNSTREHPIQSFQWADYGAVPGHEYTYTVEALTGPPSALTVMEKVEIEIMTEHPATGDHDIYFNRGIAGSQAFARRFGDVSPDEIPNNKGYEWLSRGLAEALWAYIETAEPGRHALRIAAYEFNYEPFLQIVQAAHARGVDIEVVYDARRDSPREANRAAIAAAGLEAIAHERTQPKSYISHNKFIVKLEDGAPVSVWTGGTNFSDGGIYGHSNVAHVVEEPRIAEAFLTYWEALKRDPESTPLKGVVEALSPLPPGRPPVGTTVLFSPRANLDALSWYADLAKAAEDGLFMTFAFGMNDIFKEVYDTATAPFRLALMEKKTRPMREGPERDAEEARIQALRNKPENVFAIGDFIRTNSVDGWLKERLTGLNSHVRYVHNKFMLIDPLSQDPIVIGGSANFSDASTRRNDENMVITRGNTRVADIYLGEFMRLFSHHAFRESLEWRDADEPPKPLRTDDWWQSYFGDTPRSTRRKYFARLF